MRSIGDRPDAARWPSRSSIRFRPSSASSTTTWIRVPKTEVSRAQGAASIASSACARARRRHLEHRVAGEDALELGDGAQRDEAAGVDEGEPVAVLGLVEVVRGDEDGDASPPTSRR